MRFQGKPVWQCESEKAWVNPDTLTIECSGHEETLDDCHSRNIIQSNHLPMRQRLEFFGNHWGLSNPVFYCKCLTKDCCIDPHITSIDPSLLPQSYQGVGIRNVYKADLLMWSVKNSNKLSAWFQLFSTLSLSLLSNIFPLSS